jgi:hypothetical protein
VQRRCLPALAGVCAAFKKHNMSYRGELGLKLSLLASLLWGSSALAGTATGTLAVNATVVSKNVCKLSSSNVLRMDFLVIDPSSKSDVTKQLTWSFVCKGSSSTVAWTMSAGNGQNPSGTGQRQMLNTSITTSTLLLPYSLTISPSFGTAAKGATVSVTLTGTVAATDFQVAWPGSYSDNVAITVAP